MTETTFTYQDHDGIDVFVRKWTPPEQSPRAVVQIAHGMQEHSGRYDRAAGTLGEAGYIVYADDHRGHGKTALEASGLGRLGPGGWTSVVKDLGQLTELIQEEHPSLPIFLLGHSWGSFLAQAYMQRWGDRLTGVMLSGTNGRDPLAAVGVHLAQWVAKLSGEDAQAGILEKMSIGRFNKRFEPGATGLEWLSRDAEEVRRFVDDPLCGQPCPNSFFVEMTRMLAAIWRPENERCIPRGLPIFVFAGSEDPVGARTKGIRALLERYDAYGIREVAHKFYPGGRHEMLNEINRDEVYQDIIAWSNAHVS